MTSLSEYVAAALVSRAPQLAAHWQTRARAATPRQGDVVAPPAAQTSEAAPLPEATGDAAAPESAVAVGPTVDVVRALAAGLTMDAWPVGEVMRLGWAAGVAAHAGALAVSHVQRDADLLLAVVLAETERLCAEAPAPAVVDATSMFGLVRRLQRLTASYAQAGVAGFLHTQRSILRAQWRTLRHDLRNPIGTIQSALALMDDEALPLESRQGPRMRAMVARNAGTLATLVTAGLDDQAAGALLGAEQAVSLRDVAYAARREVREASWLAGVEVEVDAVPDLPLASLEPATVELALTALLLAGLAHATAGTVLRVDRVADGTAPILRLSAAPGAPGSVDRVCWDEPGLALAATLLAELGGRLSERPSTAGKAPPPAGLVPLDTLYVILPPVRTPRADGSADDTASDAPAETPTAAS